MESRDDIGDTNSLCRVYGINAGCLASQQRISPVRCRGPVKRGLFPVRLASAIIGLAGLEGANDTRRLS